MLQSQRKAFTMMELVFVIAVIGILSAVAIPKLSATRDDAVISKAISTVAAVRNAVATERQKRMLRGDFATTITEVAAATGTNIPIFDTFSADRDGNTNPVMEYPLTSCATATSRGCWITNAVSTYVYRMPASTTDITFAVNNNFNCTSSAAECSQLPN